MTHITPAQALARWLYASYHAGVSAVIEAEASRSILNAVATGIAGSASPAWLDLFQGEAVTWGRGDAPILGTSRSLHAYAAAACNAFAVTQDDFDDAHPETIVHPASAALSGVLSAVPDARPSGRQVLAAHALACEAELLVAAALSRSHYEMGWHTSSTCAPIGAAVGAGLIHGFDVAALASVIDLAAVRVIGIREAHGTLMKGYQVGQAAAAGVRAAAVVGAGASSIPPVLGVHPGTRGLTRERGFELTTPNASDLSTWEMGRVMYKVFPAGVVCATGIEAALDLHPEVEAADITAVEVGVAPLVIQLAGIHEPVDSMQARVSLPHGVAVALDRGRAGLAEFSDAALNDPDVGRLRRKVTMIPVDGVSTTWVRVRVDAGRGWVERTVEEPLGGAARPLSEEELERKAVELIESVVPGQSGAVVDAVRRLPVDGIDSLLAAACNRAAA